MRVDTTKSEGQSNETFPYPCLCAEIRKTGRILTRKYDHYLKPSGIKITQFSMLANIAGNPGLTVSELAKLLWLEQTTVTRNLQVLEKSGYILLEAETADFRIKRIRMTDNGQSKMEEARPFWERAQWEMERTWGREGIWGLLESLKKMAE